MLSMDLDMKSWQESPDSRCMKSRLEDRHFADNIFKCISLNKNFRLFNRMPLKSFPKDLINNTISLFQWLGADMINPYLKQWRLRLWYLYALLGLDGLSFDCIMWYLGKCNAVIYAHTMLRAWFYSHIIVIIALTCLKSKKYLGIYPLFMLWILYAFWVPEWWALWLLWWPLADAAMFQCAYW